MATVILPELARKYSPDTLTYEVTGTTVSEVLHALSEKVPGMKEKLFKSNGELRALYVILVDSKDIRMLQGADTPVCNNSKVILLAALAGG